MLGNKLYTGIVLDDEYLKVATVEVSGKSVSLVSLDKVRLVESLKKKTNEAVEQVQSDDIFSSIDDNIDDDNAIFGLEEDDGEVAEIEEDEEEESIDLEGFDDDLGDLDFDDLDEADDIVDTDMVGESEAAASNELLLYNLFSATDSNRVDVGLSIPAGETIYQILKDVDFSETKKKDLQVIIDDRLESLHGVSKGKDYYSYTVREDGALLLTSIDDEPDLLKLLNKTRDLYRGKLFINDILPDEVILLGLIRANYDLEINSITSVVQFGENSTRVLFLKGDQLWIVSPIIPEGTKNKKFLNTIFSKILFQLDTGEVPNLDRIILCDNSLGDESIEFFEERFQDVDVTEFEFSEDVFQAEGIEPSSVSAFTTAIGAAWSASGFKKEVFPDISFLPGYVKDRQKIFKLQWHGFMLLLFILLTPIVSNYFYTSNAAEIDRLENEINTLDSQIRSLEPTVQSYNRISNELQQIQTKLTLLGELNQGTLRWSTNFNLLNSGVEDINSLWLTSMTQSDNNIQVDGYAIYRNRIPQFADLFDKATLVDVTTAQIREQDVYEFRYIINRFYDDQSVYTPESVQGIESLIGGQE